MHLDELDYQFPEELIATEPKDNFRSLLVSTIGDFCELSKHEVLSQMAANDVLVINDTRVLKRRVFSTDGNCEILFIERLPNGAWEVLFPARSLAVGEALDLPDGVQLELLEKGLPQKVMPSRPLDNSYFEKWGEVALPPYIQKARQLRHAQANDDHWYQTAWARKEGSCAAPTASLHFTNADLQWLRQRGVIVVPLTLHVGLGTFLPVKCSDLNDHSMHREYAFLPKSTLDTLVQCKLQNRKIWALGTTVTRALESWGAGLLQANEDGDVSGWSDLFIKPGFEFKVIDVLMTNFHQPRSTLLAMVFAFAGRERVLAAYQWAIERQFRLFSYGDLSIWTRPEPMSFR